MEAARKAMDEAEYETAIRRAEDALNIVEQNKAILRGGEMAELKGNASRSVMFARAKNDQLKDGKDDIAVKEAAEAEARKQQVQAAMQRKLIKNLREDAQKMAESRRYIEAIDLYKRLLAQEPNDSDAKLQLKLLEDKVQFRTADQMQRAAATEMTKTSIAAKEASIPYSDVLTYPEDWVETTRLRK
jgi:hypothetical protein